MIDAASRIEKDAKASEFAEFFVVAPPLTLFANEIFIIPSIVIEDPDAVPVAGSLRNDPCGIPVVPAVVQQETHRQIMTATLRHAKINLVLVVAIIV